MIILKEFRRLIKEKLYFFIMLCVIQMVMAFGILFLIGVIDNAKNIANQDYLTKRFAVTITSDATYGEIEQVVKKIVMNKNNNISEVTLYSRGISVNDDATLSLSSSFSVMDGKYVKSANNSRYEKALKNGRFYTGNEMNNGAKVAIARNFNKDSNGPLVIDGEDYEIIGEIYHGELSGENIVFVTPKAFANIKYVMVDFASDTIITEKTCKTIIEAMDTVIPGQYETDAVDEKRMDNKGISKSVIGASIFLLTLVSGTIISIYSFWIKENNYRLGVWKLLGCEHFKAANMYTIQMILTTIPSVILGSMIFIIIKNKYLLGIYPYMNYFYSYKIYIGTGIMIFMVIVSFVFLSCVVSTRGKIRKILL